MLTSTKRRRMEKTLQQEEDLQIQKDFMIPKSSFRHALAEVVQGDEEYADFKVDKAAQATIQEAAELQLTALMGRAFEISKVHGHVTLCSQEMKIVRHLQDLFQQKLPEHIERKPQPQALKSAPKRLKPVAEGDGSVADEENTLRGATSEDKSKSESAPQ